MSEMLKIQAIDPHVHDRDGDESYKEDISSATRAASKEGISGVGSMPNNVPHPIDSLEAYNDKIAKAQKETNTYYGAFVVATAENYNEIYKVEGAIGLKIYLDNTHGELFVRDLEVLRKHFENWDNHKPIAVHAEDASLALAIGLAATSGRHLHVCHVSQESEILMIKQAKNANIKVTCEVTPHHLFLTEKDASALGPFGYMKPELGTERDRLALWDNISVIDILASDHAPHTIEEKLSDNPPPGVPGLETMLPLMLKAVHEKRITLEKLIDMVYVRPVEIYGFNIDPETYALIDTSQEYVVSNKNLVTKCGWSPFEGAKVRGVAREVYIKGQLAYKDGEFFEIKNRKGLVYDSKK